MIRHKIFDSITKVKATDWNEIFGDIPEGYQFYKTLEESGLAQFCFYYIVLYERRRPILIAPLFTADLSLDIGIEGIFGNFIQRIRKFAPNFLVMKTLFLGSPFGENGIIGIRSGLHDRDALMQRLAMAMNRLRRSAGASFTVFKDFPEKEAEAISSIQRRGFFRTKSLPSVVTELEFDSFDDYIKSLSYSKRKDLRRKMKKARANSEIEVKEVDDVNDIIDDVYRLYINTYNAGKVKFEKLTKEFFINVAGNLKPHVKFFLYYANGDLGAFNLCFVYDNLFIDKFIGFDYDISYKHNLYFFSWCHNVEWCITRSIRFYQTGQTDYHPKVYLGGKKVPLYAYAKHPNVIYNPVLRLLGGIMRS